MVCNIGAAIYNSSCRLTEESYTNLSFFVHVKLLVTRRNNANAARLKRDTLRCDREEHYVSFFLFKIMRKYSYYS